MLFLSTASNADVISDPVTFGENLDTVTSDYLQQDQTANSIATTLAEPIVITQPVIRRAGEQQDAVPLTTTLEESMQAGAEEVANSFSPLIWALLFGAGLVAFVLNAIRSSGQEASEDIEMDCVTLNARLENLDARFENYSDPCVGPEFDIHSPVHPS